MPSPPSPRKKRYGEALSEAIRLSRLTRYEVAKPCDVVTRTVARWEAGETEPNPFQNRVIVHLLHETGRIPRPLLVELALASADTLESLGLESPPAASAPPPVVRADAQKIVDDAVREAAERLDLAPRLVRPVAQRLFEAIANASVPADVAARLAVGAQRKD